MNLYFNGKVSMKWLSILLCFTLMLSFVTLLKAGECPPNNYTNECNCTDDSIAHKTTLLCRGALNLTLDFGYIAYYLKDWEKKVFDHLEIVGCEIPFINESDDRTSLMAKNDLFVQLKFRSIAIRSCNVVEVDPHLLAGTSSTLRSLTMDFPKLVRWEEVFHSIIHLTNLEKLLLPANDRMILPDYAFDKHIGNDKLALETLHFSNINGGYIIRIGSYSFRYFSNLKQINFEYVGIGAIDDYAFALKNPNAVDLEITFSADLITDTVIDKDAFRNSSAANINRKVTIIFKSYGNASKVCGFALRKEIYKPFLDENERNEISIGCTVDCNKMFVTMIWIFSTPKYKNHIKGLCLDGTEISKHLGII